MLKANQWKSQTVSKEMNNILYTQNKIMYT